MHSHRFARAAAAAGAILATGAVVVAPAVAASATRTIACKGNDTSCTAVVSLAGGASNVKLKIELSGTNLKLKSTTVKPSSVRGAYSLSKGTYSLGGSLYTATLNAVRSISKGSTLTLRFATPAASSMSCKSVTRAITSLTIAKQGSKQAKGAYSCQQANALGDTWALRFNAREQVQRFSVNDVRYTCGAIPSLKQNTQCTGGGTAIRFAAPTGH
jgi:hypothetical protein